MEATQPDDKIQAVVALVLQAVDQRLEHVREQLLQVTNTIAHNHAELSRRIDDCQRLAETAVHASTTGAGSAAAAATGQLVAAANTLTERVEFLESRVNQYTDERIAQLTALIQQVAQQAGGVAAIAQAPAAVAPAPRPAAAVPPVAAVAPAVVPAIARIAPLGAVAAPAAAATPAPVVAAPTPAPVAVAARVAAPAPAPAPIDIELLSAQMSERLAAAVDRALGAMPANVGVPVNSA